MLDTPFLLDDPFYEGIATPRLDIPGLAVVAIDGHPYAIEPRLYRRSIVPPFREPVDQSAEPSEVSLTTKGSWARTGRRWDHGAGQHHWDETDSDKFRFRASQGVDVWSTRGEISLLHDTRKIRTYTGTNSITICVGGYIYTVEGAEIFHTNGPGVANPTWTDANCQAFDGAPETITSVTTDGGRVWGACGTNGIFEVAVGGTTGTQFSATQVDNVWYANGRMFASKDAILYEIDGTGAPSVIKTHDNSAFTWRVVAAANNGVYASGHLADQNELFYMGVDDTGAVTVPRFAAPLPDGEYVLDLKFYAGVMLARTNKGVRLGIIQGDNGISFGSFIPVPADPETIQGSLLEPQGEEVWFDWPGIGLGRARLSQFTDTLVPAYASDLAASDTGAISGIVSYSTETDADGLPIYKRYFMVRGSGLWAEYDTLVASGTIDSGWIDYNTPLSKILHSLDYRHDPLEGTILFTLTADNDPDNPTDVAIASIATLTGPSVPVPVVANPSEAVELRITLERSATDVTAGPTLRRWTLRSFPITVPTTEWYLPIYLRQHVDTAPGKQMTMKCEEELEHLEDLVLRGSAVTMQIGGEVARVRVNAVEAPPDEGRRWTDDGRFLQGIYMVHVVEVN